MSVLVWILAATIVNSLAALAGVVTLFCSKKTLNKVLFALVGFSAGALLAGAFFHLLAESLETLTPEAAFAYLFFGFIFFFLIERVLHWRHCHEGNCDVHPVSQLILLGDGIHNFIDGLIIAASFLVNISFGIVTTLLILGHELPQELGDFGVLVYSGYDRKKALAYNFLVQLSSIAGGILGFFLGTSSGLMPILLPFAAGGFIYISASDLIPEFHKEMDLKKTILAFIFFMLGIAFMVGTKTWLG
ncbi:MAG: ZIP family metal transporter [Candidatus Diapherotrites archaeon]|uniref:ZIP family metal transporter n=1 Tax=Candidatus Iainarchaeum sp. TaxID=3101447 RepID=A0A2D6M0T8_9ARCH|nr:ZIP family metal transporter [Candidatus Diapherotrites archaeon]|tara:strand:- start:20709 stop:21446 length:738 start_codon:yes stop_codon:yes gene_type:complete